MQYPGVHALLNDTHVVICALIFEYSYNFLYGDAIKRHQFIFLICLFNFKFETMQEYYLLTRFLLEGRNSLLCMIMLYATDGINILEMH